jgi:mono/diheme cytochrome c family protein
MDVSPLWRDALPPALALAVFLGVGRATLADAPPLNAVGPPLTTLHSKLADPNWLVAWLLKPSQLRPGTTMPDSGLTVEEAQAAARYLLAGNAPARAGAKWQGGDARTGEKLFVTRGCRGCHGIAPADAGISPRVPNLSGIGIKVSGEWLFNWIKSPRSYNPRTPMPQLALSDQEVRDLVAYLLTRGAGADLVAVAPHFNPSARPEAGRAVLQRYECAKCHAVSGLPPPSPALELAKYKNGGTDAALHDGRALVAYYNCRGCHRIEGSGGAIAEHLERKTFAPPTLEGEGARVQHSWLVRFLRQPTTLRPWLEMRMPAYGFSEAEANALANYFAAVAGVRADDESLDAAPAETAARGLRRIAHFKCAQCHPSGSELPKDVDPENLSINFMMAKSRLRPSWIKQFLARPKAIVGTQTRMPAVFYTTDGVPKIKHPDGDIEAIAAYLLQMTEPLDKALASLEQGRRAEEEKQKKVDWTTFQY